MDTGRFRYNVGLNWWSTGLFCGYIGLFWYTYRDFLLNTHSQATETLEKLDDELSVESMVVEDTMESIIDTMDRVRACVREFVGLFCRSF